MARPKSSLEWDTRRGYTTSGAESDREGRKGGGVSNSEQDKEERASGGAGEDERVGGERYNRVREES